MKKAVVTGASGFLGSYLCDELLRHQYQVTAFYHHRKPTLFQRISAPELQHAIQWIAVDLMDPLALAEVIQGHEVVFHCAAKVSFEKNEISELMETNISGTRNVVNACIAAGKPALVHASSVAALGRQHASNVVTEDTEWVDGKFNTPYAVSKHGAEMEVWRGMEEGLDVYIINPGIIVGAGEGRSGSNRIFDHVKKEHSFYPTGVNGFVGVRDVAKMMRLMYENKLEGMRFLAVAENTTYLNVLTLAANALGHRPPHRPLDGWLYRFAYGAARICEFFRIPFPLPASGLRNTHLVNQYISTNKSLEHLFGYTPLPDVLRDAAEILKRP